MATESPFFLSKVECPICKTINEFETVKVGSYVEEGRDTDFCPQKIKWRFPKYQSYNPLVFFVATCSNCYYSHEFNKSFKEWKSDTNFRTYRLRATKDVHLDQLAVSDSVVKQLGEAIDLSRFPNESAILKLHLAIFDEQAFDHHSKLDIGRYYLRIGWLFRGMESFADPLQAAMQGGCDAVYFGIKGFNMRAGAKNFKVNDLKKITKIFSKKITKIFSNLSL